MKKPLITITLFFLLITTGVISWLFSYKNTYSVTQKITVSTSPQKTFRILTNYNSWPYWSPWINMDSEAKVNIHGMGNSIDDKFNWRGPLIGEAHFQLVDQKIDKKIVLNFLQTKPFEIHSIVEFELTGTDEGTEVTWTTKGTVPFFYRFKIDQIKRVTNDDYARGLLMLKDYIEEGSVAAQVIINGPTQFNGLTFVGKRVTCDKKQLSNSMSETIEDVNNWLVANTTFPEEGVSIYNQMNTEDSCVYTIGIRINNPKSTFPYNGAIVDSIAITKAIKVTFKGKYKHLQNAWSTAYAYAGKYKYSIDADRYPFEIYLNDPAFFPDPHDWMTEVYLPIK